MGQQARCEGRTTTNIIADMSPPCIGSSAYLWREICAPWTLKTLHRNARFVPGRARRAPPRGGWPRHADRVEYPRGTAPGGGDGAASTPIAPPAHGCAGY